MESRGCAGPSGQHPHWTRKRENRGNAQYTLHRTSERLGDVRLPHGWALHVSCLSLGRSSVDLAGDPRRGRCRGRSLSLGHLGGGTRWRHAQAWRGTPCPERDTGNDMPLAILKPGEGIPPGLNGSAVSESGAFAPLRLEETDRFVGGTAGGIERSFDRFAAYIQVLGTGF